MLKVWKLVRIPLFVIGFGGLVAVSLYRNKEKSKENAKMVEKVVDVFPVALANVKIESFDGNFNATGNFEAFRELNFASETAGRVTAIYFDKGNFVTEGQTLVKLDDEAIVRELKIAQLNFDKRKKDLERFENLNKANAGTGMQLDDARFAFLNVEQQIEALKEKLAKTIVKSPISGTITRKLIEKGSFLAPAVPIAEITDISRLKMIIKVAETEMLKIQNGQNVQVEVEAYKGTKINGIVKNIAIKADVSKRYDVELDIINSNTNPLKSGMFGTAFFEFGAKGKYLMIPRKALLGSIKEAKVYITEGNIAKIKNIKVGITHDDKIEVIEGLQEGDKVVITGQINLQNGAKISVLN
ncbi:MAG: efflux RND transporter periplasmic adaptor subunit [Cytophagales bacterium]|nr:MAG: efflux RND transporter periplasmic adaptor subunit [Cytophagales bacterium]TAH29765.1 MAG: efflux RND transporter periplasmic adaptor subunit [Cytophagales bacterium]